MDWIGHHNDIAHWAMGVDRSGPRLVEAVGWTFPETDIYNTPHEYEIRCQYAGGVQTSIGSRNRQGVTFQGEEGSVFVTRGKLEASNPEWIDKGFDPGPEKVYRSDDHVANFLDGVRSRKECITPAEIAHRSITPGHLGYVSQALGRTLVWNAEQETVVNDPEANELLSRNEYRPPWG